tara:strand:- start:70 stop:219 length:150 start_codon:yes stop_codon:yes gene_type:complete
MVERLDQVQEVLVVVVELEVLEAMEQLTVHQQVMSEVQEFQQQLIQTFV